MTASKRDRALLASLAAALLTACRAGLPPEPPGADPADPGAGMTPYHVPADPYASSAFTDEPTHETAEHTDHSKMDHGKMDHGDMDHGDMDHGTTNKPSDAGAMPPDMHKPKEPPR